MPVLATDIYLSDVKLRTFSVVFPGLFTAQIVADDGRWKTFVGDHAVLDFVAYVEDLPRDVAFYHLPKTPISNATTPATASQRIREQLSGPSFAHHVFFIPQSADELAQKPIPELFQCRVPEQEQKVLKGHLLLRVGFPAELSDGEVRPVYAREMVLQR